MSSTLNKPLKISESSRQSSLIENADSTVLSVEQLNLQIKQILEGQMHLLWVRGEISNFKKHTSGHFYFSLKDAKSQISAVMFRGNNARLKFLPQDGMEVIVRGKISVYEPRGGYQIVCDMMEPVGAGALQKAFEQLKAKLKAEGLFEPQRKRPLPAFPRHVAVVTSPTGAAIRDILNILKRRAPGVLVTVVPTIVQGEGAAIKIAQALLLAQQLNDVDVIICGRGGGSIEDLWAFNDEALARTIAECRVPVVSAVGHEIDFTIADFVADLRAPTPSAAAELVAKSTTELTQRVMALQRLLEVSWRKYFHQVQQKLQLTARRLVDPQKRLIDLRLRNDDLVSRLEFATSRYFEQRRNRLERARGRLVDPKLLVRQLVKDVDNAHGRLVKAMALQFERKGNRTNRLMQVLDGLSPLRVVDRGYSLVLKGKEVVKDSAQVQVADRLNIRLAKGDLEVVVEKKGGS